MSNSRRRGPVPNAIRLSLDTRGKSSTFDPSRFGEIEISADLRAKMLNFELSRASKSHSVGEHGAHRGERALHRRLPRRQPWLLRALPWIGGLLALMALAAVAVWAATS